MKTKERCEETEQKKDSTPHRTRNLTYNNPNPNQQWLFALKNGKTRTIKPWLVAEGQLTDASVPLLLQLPPSRCYQQEGGKFNMTEAKKNQNEKG